LRRNLSKFITQAGLYCSKQLETTFHQFCEKPLHVTFKSVEILAAAAQLYVKSHLTRMIALSCGINISPVGFLD